MHTAAGGPVSAPICVSIDDNPTLEQYRQQLAPYLRAGEFVIGRQRVGIDGNSTTIDWVLQDGLGSRFRQHDGGTPTG